MTTATLLAALIIGSQASGAPIAPETSHRTYLETVIRALAQTDDAIAAINKVGNNEIMGKLTALKNAKIETEVAARTIAPFADAGKNENRKAASDGLVSGFAILLKSLDIQVSLYTRLDSASKAEDLQGMRAAGSDAASMYNQASKVMIDAAGIAVASAAVADPRDRANHIALEMTAADRDGLVKRLREGFGGKLIKTNGDTGPANAAKVMLNALQQEWRFAPKDR